MSGINTGAYPANAGTGSAQIETSPVDEILNVISLQTNDWISIDFPDGIYTLQFLPTHIDANAPVIQSLEVLSTADYVGNSVDFYQEYPSIYDTFFYGTYTFVFTTLTTMDFTIKVGLSVATPNVTINATSLTIVRLGDA